MRAALALVGPRRSQSIPGKEGLAMTNSRLLLLLAAILGGSFAAHAQSAEPCAALATIKIEGVEIAKTALVPAGFTVPLPYPGAPGIGPLPAHCRVDGVIND